MSSLSDLIEQYLRDLLEKRDSIEIQRRQLAQMFRCAPSQINYVLETRFTMEDGYLIVSRRGGGGYIKSPERIGTKIRMCLGRSKSRSGTRSRRKEWRLCSAVWSGNQCWKRRIPGFCGK